MTRLAVLGAPGCGKTRFLMGEYVRMIPDNQIILTTFSRDTADDIRCRLSDVTGRELKKDTVNTLHGVCYEMLGGKGHAELIESKDSEAFYKDTGLKMSFNLDPQISEGRKGSLIECVSWLKNTGTSLSRIVEYPGWMDIKQAPAKAREIIKAYEQWKQENNKIDFTDMLDHVRKDGIVPDTDVLMVDEFQDLTKLQHDIFKIWSAEIENIIIAGDPMQSIYEFWGGSPEYFNQFDGDRIVLPKSYRLPSTIWNYAQAIAKQCGMDTPVIETGTHPGMIRKLTHKQYVNDVSLWGGKTGFRVYHLIRSNYQASPITHILADNGILWNGLNGWSLSEISVTNAIISARSGNALTPQELAALVESYPNELFNAGKTKAATLEQINNLNAPQFPGGCGVVSDKLYDILLSNDPVSYMSRPGELKTKKINNVLRLYNRPLTLDDFNTSLLTIHASKGLEANRVFLHTGITGNIKKTTRRNKGAEARVFYVGVSRAIDELFIVKDAGDNYSLPGVAM